MSIFRSTQSVLAFRFASQDEPIIVATVGVSFLVVTDMVCFSGGRSEVD